MNQSGSVHGDLQQTLMNLIQHGTTEGVSNSQSLSPQTTPTKAVTENDDFYIEGLEREKYMSPRELHHWRKSLFSVYIGKLPGDVTPRELYGIFKSVGDVKDFHIQPSESAKSHTYGFMRFKTLDEARRAVSRMNGRVLGNHHLIVELASETRSVLSADQRDKEVLANDYDRLLRKDYPSLRRRSSEEKDADLLQQKVAASLTQLKTADSSPTFLQRIEEILQKVAEVPGETTIVASTDEGPACPLRDFQTLYSTPDTGYTSSRCDTSISGNAVANRNATQNFNSGETNINGYPTHTSNSFNANSIGNPQHQTQSISNSRNTITNDTATPMNTNNSHAVSTDRYVFPSSQDYNESLEITQQVSSQEHEKMGSSPNPANLQKAAKELLQSIHPITTAGSNTSPLPSSTTAKYRDEQNELKSYKMYTSQSVTIGGSTAVTNGHTNGYTKSSEVTAFTSSSDRPVQRSCELTCGQLNYNTSPQITLLSSKPDGSESAELSQNTASLRSPSSLGQSTGVGQVSGNTSQLATPLSSKHYYSTGNTVNNCNGIAESSQVTTSTISPGSPGQRYGGMAGGQFTGNASSLMTPLSSNLGPGHHPGNVVGHSPSHVESSQTTPFVPSLSNTGQSYRNEVAVVQFPGNTLQTTPTTLPPSRSGPGNETIAVASHSTGLVAPQTTPVTGSIPLKTGQNGTTTASGQPFDQPSPHTSPFTGIMSAKQSYDITSEVAKGLGQAILQTSPITTSTKPAQSNSVSNTVGQTGYTSPPLSLNAGSTSTRMVNNIGTTNEVASSYDHTSPQPNPSRVDQSTGYTPPLSTPTGQTFPSGFGRGRVNFSSSPTSVTFPLVLGRGRGVLCDNFMPSKTFNISQPDPYEKSMEIPCQDVRFSPTTQQEEEQPQQRYSPLSSDTDKTINSGDASTTPLTTKLNNVIKSISENTTNSNSNCNHDQYKCTANEPNQQPNKNFLESRGTASDCHLVHSNIPQVPSATSQGIHYEGSEKHLNTAQYEDAVQVVQNSSLCPGLHHVATTHSCVEEQSFSEEDKSDDKLSKGVKLRDPDKINNNRRQQHEPQASCKGTVKPIATRHQPTVACAFTKNPNSVEIKVLDKDVTALIQDDGAVKECKMLPSKTVEPICNLIANDTTLVSTNEKPDKNKKLSNHDLTDEMKTLTLSPETTTSNEATEPIESSICAENNVSSTALKPCISEKKQDNFGSSRSPDGRSSEESNFPVTCETKADRDQINVSSKEVNSVPDKASKENTDTSHTNGIASSEEHLKINSEFESANVKELNNPDEASVFSLDHCGIKSIELGNLEAEFRTLMEENRSLKKSTLKPNKRTSGLYQDHDRMKLEQSIHGKEVEYQRIKEMMAVRNAEQELLYEREKLAAGFDSDLRTELDLELRIEVIKNDIRLAKMNNELQLLYRQVYEM